MAETNSQSDAPAEAQQSGKAFFDRADQTAEVGEWDYAIELYYEGLKREPANLERGHQPLREVALNRKLSGGKPAGFREKLKYGATKDPAESVANAAFLLAKDPPNREYMQRLFKAARDLGDPGLIEWTCDLLMEEQRQAKRPNRQLVMEVIDSYENVESYAKAINACQLLREQNPNDDAVIKRVQDLSAKQTTQKYSGEGDLLEKVKNRKQLEEDIQRDRAVQSKSYLEEQLEKAQQEYLADTSVAGKIQAYVDALLKMNDTTYENTAIDVLNKAYQDTGSYSWKMRIDDIKMRQMTRRYRELMKRGDKSAALEQARKQLAFELEVYRERAVNYPTDLSIKFELGRREFAAAKVDPSHLDDAIAALQQAQREPRRRVQAMLLLGQAFARKQWYQEAADTFERLLEDDLTDDAAKEARYHLGDALEQMGKVSEAAEQFSQVAQIDYNYQDVRERLEKIRAKRADQESGQGG